MFCIYSDLSARVCDSELLKMQAIEVSCVQENRYDSGSFVFEYRSGIANEYTFEFMRITIE